MLIVSADYGFETPLNGRPLPGMVPSHLITPHAYYDAPGFGYRKRIRPYVGVGVGTQKSSIMGLSNDFASTADLYAWGETWVPLVTLQAGASYVVNENTEVYAGGKYSQGAEMLSGYALQYSPQSQKLSVSVVAYVIHLNTTNQAEHISV